MKTIFTMNQYLYKAVAALMLLTVSLVSVQAAESDRALKQGDTIVVSYTRTNIIGTKTTYYVKGNANGTVTSTQTLDENCLWVLKTMTGTPSAVGRENNAKVTAQHLKTGMAFHMNAAKNGAVTLTNGNYTTIYTIKDAQGFGEFIEGNILTKNGKTNYYLNWNNGWAASNTNSPQTMRIQRWSQRTTSVAEPTFYPGHAIFGWAGNESEAAEQKMQGVICDLKLITSSYYYNVSNENQQIVGQAKEVAPDASPAPTLSWEQTGMDHKMEIQSASYNSTKKEYSFNLAPTGASPVVTDQAQLNDIMDNIVCTAYYSGKLVRVYMPCTRRVFWQKELNPLSFTVTHPTYSFPLEGGSITLVPTLIYKPGTEWINTDGIVEHSYYPEGDHRVVYDEPGLMVTTNEETDWLTFDGYRALQINLTATGNNGNADRSAQVIVRVEYGVYEPIGDDPSFTGTRYSLQYDPKKQDQEGHATQVYKQDDENGTHKRTAYSEFIRQVTLRQVGELHDADIAFNHQVGRGGKTDDYGHLGSQKVHTNKKVLYYVPGTGSNYGNDVELRLTESAFFGYRRWYNFDTEHGIQNSPNAKDNTVWSDAPHIEVTSGRSTTSINYTPINTDNATSRGVFAINGSNTSGYRILRDGMTDPAPIIKGYKKAVDPTVDNGVHTIACDLSAFTDYTITENNGKLTGITEPTLSYRQLFELHPASEVAEAIKNLADGKYLEEYEYTAPVGADVHLSTSQRYRSKRYHNSEMGYYFYKNGNNDSEGYSQIGVDVKSVTWKKDGATFTPNYSANTDNVIVSERSAGEHVYTLEAGGKRIAKFTVTYIAKTTVGPSAAALITEDQLKSKFVSLAEINFNDDPKPGNNDNVISPNHLDWEDATFGFAYQRDAVIGGTSSTGSRKNARPANKDLCYYGEYLLVNRWNKTGNYGWMDPKIENRGGKANGYMLFADGTMEPSMVASIQTDVQICSGQQMYCAAWIANACPSGYSGGANPIFRFNVQGRNSDSEEWEDVSVFFAGDLPKGSGWQQINFPVSANQSFSQTRVCVYNFATTNTGNDFFLDDIYLYATPLPLSAYQASTSCAGSDIAIVVKVDYRNVDREASNRDVYYQGWIEIDDDQNPGQKKMIAIPNLATYRGQYMWGDELKTGDDQTVGMLHIPSKDFVPQDTQEKKLIYNSVQEFIDHLTKVDKRAGIFYIQQDDGNYAMYVAHLLQGRDGGQYEVRMATQEEDLAHPLCAMSVRLPIYKETKITYGNNEDLTQPKVDACPNVDDVIRVTVTNRVSGATEGGITETVIGRADWLIGFSFDSIYAPVDYCKTHYKKNGVALTDDDISTMRAAADAKFLTKYGYTREEVMTAIVYDMRREPYENHPNPNYDVSDPSLLDSMAFFTLKDYHIVKSLCDNGLLDLNVGSRTVMLTPGDSIFLWVYPIVGSAIDAGGHKLAVCNQPQWVDFRAPKMQGETQQIMNLSPIENKDKTPAQRLQNGSVRVSASKVNTSFQMPLKDIQNAVFGWDSLRVVDTDDPEVKNKLTHPTTYPTFSMRYYTDKVYQSTNGVLNTDPNYKSVDMNTDAQNPVFEYYKKGDVITFRPINQTYVNYLRDRRTKSDTEVLADRYTTMDANWISKEVSEHTGTLSQPGYQHVNTDLMKANYTYHLKTNLVTNSFAGEHGGTVDGCQYGVAFFDVVVIPDLLIWRPQVTNDWGDDNNWHAIIGGVEQAWGFAPNEDASVIIPALDNPLLYPAVTGINLYPMSYGYNPTVCRNIYLQAGAHILGQEKLSYNKAYIDMPMLTNDWNLISAPLQGMYSGDFYVPHTGTYASYTNGENVVYTTDTYGKVTDIRVKGNNDVLFDTHTIQGIRSADAAYVTYTEFYNSNVQIYHHNLSDGTHTTSQGFSPSNGLDNPIAPGQGINALSFGPNNKGEHTPYALRLPKTETQYTYYKDGSATEFHTGTLTRTNANKFAFTTTGTGEAAQMTITLTNNEASSFFMLGNPTMAYVDMGEFFKDNNTVLSGTFYYLHGGAWSAKTTTMEDFFLSPMEAILVETYGATPQTTIDVVLKAGHLTLNNHSYVQGYAPARAPEPASAPRRAAAASDAPVELLTITAFTDDAQGMAYLGKKDGTSLNYIPGEDACFISSGVETEDDVITPMNIYTVRDSSTMMVDVRPALSRIPLGFVIATNERASNDSINLCFNTNLQWDSELYLVDTNTGESTRVQDGLIVRVETPANHEQRYVLMGTDMEPVIGPGISTGIENTEVLDPEEPTMQQPEKFFHNGLFYIRHTNGLYTITGLRVK